VLVNEKYKCLLSYATSPTRKKNESQKLEGTNYQIHTRFSKIGGDASHGSHRGGVVASMCAAEQETQHNYVEIERHASRRAH